jgi:EAL domain-containing protein (putative c-di-GMP-specific phosphodiesterase class I)
MPGDPQDAAIVRSTVDLGRRLGLHVVAEGVASADALALLADCGCHAAQGFHISPPLPADRLERWLHESPQRL